jgi:hypothetical protein
MGSGMTTGVGVTNKSALALLVMLAGVASVVGVIVVVALAVSTMAAGSAVTVKLTRSDAAALLIEEPAAAGTGETEASAAAVSVTRPLERVTGLLVADADRKAVT